ncbi:MAG: thioredoxin domain-containing protein [Candidatus Omnitrophota bacterium]
MSKWKLFVTLGVIAGVVAVVAVLKWSLFFRSRQPAPVIAGRMAGDLSAPVKIVEFADFQCPPCAQASEILDRLFREPNKRYSLEFRYFPLAMHRHGFRAALVAQCALEQGKFWDMHDVLFRSQEDWGSLENPDDYFLGLARSLGMDDLSLMKCVARPVARAVVEQDIVQAKNMGVKATPTFFINGEMVVGLPELEKALKELKL